MNRLLLLPLIIACSALFTIASAEPRFAVRTGDKCQSCHVDPAGGGMRQTLGVQYGRDELPCPALSKEYEMEDFSNVITNVLGVGADFRTLYYAQEQPSSTATNRFLQMQGDLYLNLHVSKKVSIFLRKGLYDSPSAPAVGFEAYGLFNILPASGHIKVGRFTPNYGTRLDDHTSFIRLYTGFAADLGPERTGVEASVSPGPFTFTGGISNAEENQTLAVTNEKGLLGRAEGMFKLSERAALGLGGNVFTKVVDSVRSTFYAGFGSISVNGVTLLGETDWIRSASEKVGATQPVTGLAVYGEGDVVLTQGVEFTLAYDFYDPDISLKTGTRSRYTFGFAVFPLGGVELRPMFRLHDDTNTGKWNELDLILHLYI